MSITSQEPRGSGLSASLVSDFRAIMSALEKQRNEDAFGQPEPPVARSARSDLNADNVPSVMTVSSSEPSAPAQSESVAAPAETTNADQAQTARPSAPAQRPAVPERRVLKPHSEMRGKFTALGDVRDMVPDRRAPVDKVAPTSATTPDVASSPRRRAFGTACAEGEASARRRKAASKDVITWQRLGVLAIFMAAVGGGASMLQSVVGRDEAKVSADAIGNAAIASVAPSQALPMAMTPSEPAPAVTPEPTRSVAAPALAAPALRSAVAASAPNNLMTASLATSGRAPSDSSAGFAALPASVSAFAATEVASASPISVPTPAALPKQAPLPPTKQVALAVAPAPAAQNDQPDDTVDDSSATTAPFGGAPTDTVTIRSSVTMRAAPKKGARPIGNIPSGRKVDLVACTSWCEVITDGKRGFIYKSFVGASASKEAAAADGEAAAETVTQ